MGMHEMKHPEQAVNEAWVGNTYARDWPPPHLAGLVTARIGEQAYDIGGAKLNPSEFRPLFVGHSEYDTYNRIMEARVRSNMRGGGS